MSIRTRRTIDLTALESETSEPRGPHADRTRRFYERHGKRAFDLVIALLTAAVMLPLLIALMLLSVILYGRPPIVRVPSVGEGGAHFDMLRLRTSTVGTTRVRAWPRATEWLRRWGLDELPQLWNVVRGQMSLVGPRSIRPEAHGGLLQWEQQRHEVKPGITGLWQLESRTTGDLLSDTVHYDIQYIDQLSLRADVSILLRTPWAIAQRGPARREDAHKPHNVLHARLLLADLMLWSIAIPVAAWMHHEFSWSQVDVRGALIGVGLAAVVQLIFGARCGMYRGRWKLASREELAVVGAVAGIVLACLLLVGALGIQPAPRGALVASGAIYLAGAFAARSRSALTHLRSQHAKRGTKVRRLLVFGAGEGGVNAAKAIWADQTSSYLPVAFLDDDVSKHRTSILGLPVLGGRHGVVEMARRYDATALLIAMPSAHPREVNEISALGEAAGLEVQVVPPLEQWLSTLLVERARTATPPSARERKQVDQAMPPDRLRPRTQGTFDLAVIGLGYVGLPLVLEAVSVGLRVYGLDVDASRVAALNKGISYVTGVTDEELREALEGQFVANTDPSILANADAITVSVPTPLRDGLPDLSAVIGASETVGDYLRPGQLVVLESTTYPGTTEEVMQPILEERSGLRAGVDFFLAYSPERIDPGNADWGISNTPKLIAGVDPVSTEKAAMLYRKFCPVVTMSGTREAEMAKLLENTYRHVNIALINEMAVFCNQLGVDIWETIRGAATKPFGFQAFYPGPGVGGHCIPIDPNYLSYRVRQLGEQFRFIELAQEINDFMPRYVVDRAVGLLSRNGIDAEGARVLIVGVAYKPDIDDVRETPATAIIRQLAGIGAVVDFVDPHVESMCVDDLQLVGRTDPVAAAAEADLTLIHTPHSILDLREIAGAAGLVFDVRGVLPDPVVSERL